MNYAKRIAELFLKLLGQIAVIISVSFIVLSGSAGGRYAGLHVLYRYVLYIRDLATLSLGVTGNNVPVEFYIIPAIGRSVAVLTVPLVGSILIALWLARRSFIKSGSRLSSSADSLLSFGYSIPIPFLAVLLFAFAGATGWFPMGMTSSVGSSEYGLVQTVLDRVHHLVLPWLTVGIFPVLMSMGGAAATVSRVRRAGYVEAAFARGLSPRQVFSFHIRRPTLVSVIEQLAAAMPLIITYMALTESVFRYTGLGFYLVQPLTMRTGFGAENEMQIAQAALVYIAIFSVTTQFLFRVIVESLVPQLRQRPESPDVRERVILGVGFIAVLAGIALGLLPQVAVPHSLMRWGLLGIPILLLLFFFLLSGKRPKLAARRPDQSPGETNIRPPASQTVSAGVEPVATRPAKISAALIPAILKRYWPLMALALLTAAAYILPPPEPLSPLANVNPSLVPLGVRMQYYSGASLFTLRSIAHIFLVSLVSLVGAWIAAIASVRVRPPFLAGFFSLLGLFPVILVVVMLLQTPGTYAAFAIAFLLVGLVRYFPRFRDKALLLEQQPFLAYPGVLGKSHTQTVFWHYLPNFWREMATGLFILSADLVVLRANLRFVGIWVSWTYDTAIREGERAVNLVDRFALQMYRLSWGYPIAQAVRHFVRGYYLPVIFPLLFLLITVALLRGSATALQGGGHR